MRRICVFCGAATGADPAFERAAREVGDGLARRGLGVVFGGGRVGLMGAVADAALAAGGEVLGVIPAALVERELGHEGVTELFVVESMHERKQLMHALSDGFLTLPGGLGTLDELFETLTWLQLGIHAKPVGLLDVGGFYAPLVAQLQAMERAGLVHGELSRLLLVDRSLDALLARFDAWRPPAPRAELEPDES